MTSPTKTIKRIKWNGRLVGTLYILENGERIFDKRVNKNVHFFLKYDGYGIQKSVFDAHLRGYAGSIYITESGDYEDEPKTRFVTTIENWAARSILSNIMTHGEQLILPISEMVKL